jgi:hypothetical protein
MNILTRNYNKLNNKLKNDSFTYNFNWFVFLFALIPTVTICMEEFFNSTIYNGTMFMRSGAIIILFGVIVEHTLSSIKPIKHMELELSDMYVVQRLIAHFYIVIGTIIWGFGDWIILEFFY